MPCLHCGQLHNARSSEREERDGANLRFREMTTSRATVCTIESPSRNANDCGDLHDPNQQNVLHSQISIACFSALTHCRRNAKLEVQEGSSSVIEERERGTPTATMSSGLLPSACCEKNLVVSSS